MKTEYPWFVCKTMELQLHLYFIKLTEERKETEHSSGFVLTVEESLAERRLLNTFTGLIVYVFVTFVYAK